MATDAWPVVTTESNGSEPAGRVTLLTEQVANQIAAGEVVERPASVAKELLENALDAEATRIRVEVEEGGIQRLRITDDGIGMNRRDAELCLQRHATSKIRAVTDIETVRTLGFRGEALPSIASVSRLTLTTRERGADEGTRIEVEGGRVVDVRATGAAPGTTIEVLDLFFNVPARRKFLKRPSTEGSHVTDILTRLAMARPEVAFRVETEHRTVLDVSAEVAQDPLGRIGRILGPAVAKRLHPVVQDDRPHAVEVRGFIAEPGLSERGTKGLYTFVNRRFVRDKTIQHAVQDAYRTLMEKGRYPVVILFIEIDPVAFDVNVHPQKTEVRFARSQDVHRAISASLSRTLSAQPWLKGAPPPRTAGIDESFRDAPPPRTTGIDENFRDAPPPLGGADENEALSSEVPRPWRSVSPLPPVDPLAEPDSRASSPSTGGSVRHYRLHRDDGPASVSEGGLSFGKGVGQYVPRRAFGPLTGRTSDVSEPSSEASASTITPAVAPPEVDASRREPSLPLEMPKALGTFSRLKPIGQILGTYLVCEGQGKMVVIDQHAAHERITFERLRTERSRRTLEVQPLLVPLTVELDAAKSMLAEDVRPRLLEMGIEIEPFGGQTWLIKSGPALLGHTDLARLVVDVLDDLAELPASSSLEEKLVQMMSCAACHTSVRAKDRLENAEIRALLEQMDEIDFGAFCPHGRPVFVEWSEGELAKLFHRT